MPDTGAPYFIPFADPTDLVRDWPALSEDVAEAVADGLDAAGGLVAVKSAIFTGTQDASVTRGGSLTVTDLTITHEVADVANKLIITAFIGIGASSSGQGNVGLAIHDGAQLIGVNTDTPGSRVNGSAGGYLQEPASSPVIGANLSVSFVHTPGSGSKTYTVRMTNIGSTTSTLYVNRLDSDSDGDNRARGISSLVIQEVKV